MFNVKISIDDYVADLKKKIKQKCSLLLRNFDAPDLIIRKVDVDYNEEMQNMIEAGIYQPAPDDQKATYWRT